MGAFGNAFGDGLGSVRQFTLLNLIKEEDMPVDAIYLATEEGYVITEQDNNLNFIIEE